MLPALWTNLVILIGIVLAMVYLVIFMVEVAVAALVLLYTLIEVAVRGLVRARSR